MTGTGRRSRSPMRSAAPPVSVTAVAGGARVSHELEHACCLKGEVTTRLQGRMVLLRERLTGSPCRCRCSSRLETAVALPAGVWTVAVDLEEGGGTRRVFQQDVTVR